MRVLISLTLFALAIQSLSAQESLSSRVLVVYDANDFDSQSVAEHYAAQRAIPPSNLCAVNLPNPWATALNGPDYDSALKRPVQDCLRSVGEQNILYIVLAYLRPYAINPGAGLNNYALDSYLADIWDQYAPRPFNPYPTREHPYYADSQSQGNAFAPFQSFASYRELHSQPLIYSVWRLDGTTPELAMGLVDKAIAAEAAGGPISSDSAALTNACIDLVIDPTNFPDSGYRTADWDLKRAADFLTATGRFAVAADQHGETFGDAAVGDCRNTALYAGWYNYGRYNDAFSWDIGAIGWDLDSAALADPRSGVWWGTNALRQGITVTSGPMNEPYLEGMARPAGTMRNLLEGANVGDAFLRNTRWLKWMILNVGDPLYTPFAAKAHPFDGPIPSNSLSLSSREVVGNGQISAVLSVSDPVPPEGLIVNLMAESDSVMLPATVTITPGEAQVRFPVSTVAPGWPSDVRITAFTESFSISNTLSVYPLLADLQVSANSVAAGNAVTAVIVLNAKAPPDGVTVQLLSDAPDVVSTPPSVFIPAGRTRAVFPIASSVGLSLEATVNITASLDGAQKTATLTVYPQ